MLRLDRLAAEQGIVQDHVRHLDVAIHQPAIVVQVMRIGGQTQRQIILRQTEIKREEHKNQLSQVIPERVFTCRSGVVVFAFRKYVISPHVNVSCLLFVWRLFTPPYKRPMYESLALTQALSVAFLRKYSLN